LTNIKFAINNEFVTMDPISSKINYAIMGFATRSALRTAAPAKAKNVAASSRSGLLVSRDDDLAF
jgi:hypothetical protein